ncbi:MAG: hypothetical protein EKK57_12100 [Proteobacteria bacterium]|nr:MAG: hypothetical protein EKK57_12100 [Pseudomonadota bacterium]
MISSNLRLGIFLFLLLVSQFLINNFTIFYVDFFGILLIVSLMSGAYSWSKMVMFSLLADIFGHWYLGTHLVSIVIISFMVHNLVNFYRMCGWFQRTLVTNVFFIVMKLVIFVIDAILSRTYVSINSLIFEIVICMPIIQLVLEKIIIKRTSEFVWYD